MSLKLGIPPYIQDKAKVHLSPIIEAINDLFEGDLTDGDKVTFVTELETKLVESEKLREQAQANTKDQFANSPDLQEEGMNATIELMEAHEKMGKQMLNDNALLRTVIAAIVKQGGLWDGLQG